MIINIYGSTGIIGKTTLSLIKKNFFNYKINLLCAKNNFKLLAKQSREYNVKYLYLDNQKLIYNDIRKFGFIKLIHSRNLFADNHLVKIGPDPLSKKFNSNYCLDYLKAKNKNIKNMLLDQSFGGGIGNIYASEILFKSKIHPQRKCSTITPAEIKKIIYFSKSVLKKSIRLGGSSIKNYTNSEGQKGKFQREFNVYSREKERCVTKSCKYKISKIIIAGRSTFYCQNCQHK